MLPMLLWINVKSRYSSFKFFLPLIFLYILLLPVIAVCATVYAFMLLAPAATKTPRAYIMFVLKSPQLIFAAKGTEITVYSNDADVKMFVK